MTRMFSEKQPYPSLLSLLLVAVVLTSACTGNFTCVHGKLVIFLTKKWNYALYAIWNALTPNISNPEVS